MIIPIGLDETRLSRLPWVSIAILLLNVAAFVATSSSSADDEAEARFRDVVGYWQEHPHLELPPAVQQRLGLPPDVLLGETRRGGGARAATGEAAAAEQARLDALCDELVLALDRTPVRRWSLVPARGAAQPGWLTSQFMHGGFGHLFGNMLVFLLVVAPFLEEAWGRPFFLAFYLAGGVAAGIAQAVPMGDSQLPILGASGAISACLGAFALRFAHRRVRMFYWFFIFVRGTFFVPAWAYAFFGLAMDLLGLKLAGAAGGIAYGAHVGGFLFGLMVAVAVRASGLDARLAPQGAARWGRTLSASRAEDALAAGRTADAQRHLEEAIEADPRDEASMLTLAQLHAARFERARATALAERLLSARFARGDEAGAREVIASVAEGIDPGLLGPTVAYRAAALVDDPGVADRLDAVAATAGGALAAKALLRSAERARASDPARARALAEEARSVDGAPEALIARADALARACGTPAPAPPVPPDADRGEEDVLPVDPPPAALDAAAPIRLVHCRLLGASGEGLDLATEDGRRAVLPHRAVAAVAGAVVAEHAVAGRVTRNAVLLDLLLHPRSGDPQRTVLRLRGHEMALATIHPGIPPAEAYARVVDALVGASGARAVPSADGAAGRPFPRFGDAAAFEAAAWGRRLAS